VEEAIKKNVDRVARLIVRAPIHGRVQQLLQRSPGEVVRAGETIARIVPLDDELVAEVRVRPEDIGSVRPGDRAQIKVTAYDFNQYGKIAGEVAEISPTTFEDEQKRLYYRALVRYNQSQVPSHRSWRLQPGMTVDAEVISGEKTLLRYLMKPVSRGIDVAFTER
jgi:adhesin transport system membrane fusion protein